MKKFLHTTYARVRQRAAHAVNGFHPIYILLVGAIGYNVLFVPNPAMSDDDLSGVDPSFFAPAIERTVASEPRKTGLPKVAKAEPRVLATRSVAKVTYYASEVAQTSGNPFITASGTRVHWGTVASNCYAFGTRIKIPELYGDQIFIVEDRHSTRFGCGLVDVWTDYAPGHEVTTSHNATVEVIEHIPGVN